MDWPRGVEHAHFASLDSTNKEARRRAPDQHSPIWISADEQTSGVGRRGRAWSTRAGNFAATLLLPLEAAPAQMALRSFVAILALGDAIAQLLPSDAEKISYKWPNDLLFDQCKVSGILLEVVAPNKLAIGIGVNTNHAPEPSKLEQSAFAPSDFGGRIDNAVLLLALANAFQTREAQLNTYGFLPIKEAWLSKAANLGQSIIARTTSGEMTGIFHDLDEDGQLILDAQGEKIRIAAAEIYF